MWEADFPGQSLPGLHSELQGSQGYIEKPFFGKPNNKFLFHVLIDEWRHLLEGWCQEALDFVLYKTAKVLRGAFTSNVAFGNLP